MCILTGNTRLVSCEIVLDFDLELAPAWTAEFVGRQNRQFT
jgi:hypothetical protein